MFRRITLLAAVLLALYVTASAVIGWLLRQQLTQQITQDPAASWLQQRLQAGVFNTGVELVTRPAAALAVQFRGQLQHGPLLRRPLQPGLMRLRGEVFLPRRDLSAVAHPAAPAVNETKRKDLTIDLSSSLLGDINTELRLPQLLDWRTAQPATGGPLQGLLQAQLQATTLQAMLEHPTGLLCLPGVNLEWQDLHTELVLADHANWLQDGRFTLGTALLGLQRGADCIDVVDKPTLTATASRLNQLQIKLRWPAPLAGAQKAATLSLHVTRWNSIGKAIGPLSIKLELHSLERTALADWLPLAIALQSQNTPATTLQQLDLAALTAAVLQPRPRLLIKQVQIDSAAGQFVLNGEIILRAGGLQAKLHGETSAAAAQLILSVLLQDNEAASEMLQQWQRLGVVQDIAGRWLIDIVVNQ